MKLQVLLEIDVNDLPAEARDELMDGLKLASALGYRVEKIAAVKEAA